MKIRQGSGGFTLLDLPVMFFVLGMLGMALVAVVRLFYGPINWYWWPIGFMALPVSLSIAACVSLWR